ncbi:hypothetical protein AUJ95_08470 [Candidatus Desantisbacteria bacterium CG2_30_40_21]|uniref:Uncharacterized protein n=3 Tax=unclassified Candidatus Desantisiibacteriota TaxID=3106372 RepID=A0A2M8ARA1_9BACT|nr:MAG: hypothetical protein AUJ95_08470 [Candidatus Desantisbacteria bacterium CG2_30_40_21]PIP42233.1 MAG: hypothetical protein COX18_00955 [Candidatus Desantisbacteria bacterium CG23_combo_of_CG06-09_8_20_14_all_40_23]PJB28315.1 MAG: hypothetical protein CO110_09865 [Candidatus Desantisbacteria bacterium CG_4_9_14_3_um_filter_40_11]
MIINIKYNKKKQELFDMNLVENSVPYPSTHNRNGCIAFLLLPIVGGSHAEERGGERTEGIDRGAELYWPAILIMDFQIHHRDTEARRIT